MLKGMKPPIDFALNFSGSDVFEQQAAAQQFLLQCDDGDHIARARLLAIVAAASVFTDPTAAQHAATEAALAAQQSADEVARAWALVAEAVVDLSCESTEKRLSLVREVLRIARETGETEFVATAYFLYSAALIELGQMEELDQALSPFGSILPHFSWMDTGRHLAWSRCLRATFDGRIEHAEQLANYAYQVAQESADPDAQTVWVAQLAIIRWMQGRVVELEPAFLHARQAAPHEPVWAVSLAWMWLRQGRKSAARALVSSLPPLSDFPVDRNWLSTASILADVASELGEIKVVQQLYDALLPFEDRLVTIGLGVTCWGTVARPLALAAAALGDTEKAIAYYRTAIEVTARSGAHPWLAEVQWELAALLAKRAHSGDHEEAVSLAAEAVATGRTLQLHGIEGGAARVLAELQTPELQQHTHIDSGGEGHARPQINVFDGFSVNSADGAKVHWQSRKARQMLKVLIARRGAAVSRETVMDLLWPGEDPHRLSNRFSVAATTVRRALDPAGAEPRDAYLEHRDGLIRLRTEEIDIDVERFLSRANAAVESAATREIQIIQLTEALALCTGEPLQEDQEEVWADDLRREVHLTFFAAAHTLAELSESAENHLMRVETYRRILSLDQYDQRAHEGLIDALMRLGAHGQAEAARAEYAGLLSILGIQATGDLNPA